jgi:hypothetical protein
MAAFRRGPYPNGIPRINRVCMRCIQLFNINSPRQRRQYYFKCRFYKCLNYLIPSDIVEAKRYSFPFTELKRYIDLTFPLVLTSLMSNRCLPFFLRTGSSNHFLCNLCHKRCSGDFTYELFDPSPFQVLASNQSTRLPTKAPFFST